MSGYPDAIDPAKVVERELERAEALMQRLDELSREQQQMIERDDLESVLGVMPEREQLVSKLGGHATSLEKCLGELGSGDAADESHALRARADALAALASDVLLRDATHQRALEARRDDAAAALTRVSSGRGALRAYSGGSKREAPRFQDRQG
ncbi:MAG: hypothetical protein AAFP26_09275 [Planctomycetota bacterium]